MHVRVVPHDPEWRRAFVVEAARIASALGPPVVRVHHIGSTAIPGLVAKPIIDLLLEVDAIERMDRQASSMEALGYEALGEFGIPGRRYFRKDDARGERTHQVHAFREGSPEVVRHLAFRAYMAAHPDDAQAYGRLKQHLAGLHPEDIEAYMAGKDAYIKDRERVALAWWASREHSRR